MNNENLDKYLSIVNEEKVKRGLEEYIPLYPMFRVVDNKLYVVVLLTHESDDVWSVSGNVKGEYWVLIDIDTDEIIEFNKTIEKDFVIGEVIPKKKEEKQKEISMYSVKKALEYKNYLINDIKNEKLPLQNELSSILGDDTLIDCEQVNMNEYLLSLLEDDIKEKIDNLVEVLIDSKYGSLLIYYDKLFGIIIKEYKNNKIILKDKIKLCVDIMNYHYDGVTYIDNLFNIGV